MRRFFLLTLIFLLLTSCNANALFQKKDYKQNFLNNAINAEKRNDNNSAFHSYEKAMYYYKKDTKVIQSYAEFCERQKYFDKAQALYEKLYTLTKDNKYLFKSHLCAIKNGKISNKEIQTIINKKYLSHAQKNELDSALIYHFSYKNDWKNVKKNCDNLLKQDINKDLITTCIVASEKTADKKAALSYYLRFSQLYPQDSETINKIISLAEEFKNYPLEEKFIKKLLVLNPTDNGIKYKLAGFYEKQGQWAKAAQVYEGLIFSGDNSEHVKKSYAYVVSQLTQKNISKPTAKYTPKPLSAYKLAEKNFYEALEAKNYSKAMLYLEKMLKKEPKNLKLLKHKVDIAIAQNNYPLALKFLQNIGKIKSFSLEDEKFLAFLYSKINDYNKALEVIENQLKNYPEDKSLLNPALEYSMANQNWNKALVYTNNLLKFEPYNEKLLKTQGDLYSINKEYTNAISAYEKLVENYPDLNYKLALANLYMASQNFAKAQQIYEPIYNLYPDNPKITDAYLNSILAQNKLAQAYWIIKRHHLENTRNGYMVLGDMAMKDKDYNTAAKKYRCAVNLEPQDIILWHKLAESYRMLGYKGGPEQIFKKILEEEPDNLEAQIGLGSLQIDRKNYDEARKIFCNILKKHPDYNPAKVALAHSYNASNYKMKALDILTKIPEDEETKMLKAQIYYDMNMREEAKDKLDRFSTKDAQELKYKIKRDNALTITPIYSLMNQRLADEFNLDYQKYGVQVSKNVKGNANVFMEYNVIWYMSGSPYFLYDVVNEFRTGVQRRLDNKWEYRTDIGVKAYQHDGAMLNTDSWLKYYFNDKFNLKIGFKRNNIEQSYLSAVGEKIDGVFTGRSAYNKVYLDWEGKLPNQFYYFGSAGYGLITSANLASNQYFEGWVGVGRALYDNPKNKWINKFVADIISYNSSYQYNQLKIYNNIGTLFGGYFSPSYFNATTCNLKAEGYIKKLHLKYGLSGFGGIQNALTPDQTTPTWGYSPYISYDINDHISINGSYTHFNFADVQRDIFLFGAVIRGF